MPCLLCYLCLKLRDSVLRWLLSMEPQDQNEKGVAHKTLT